MSKGSARRPASKEGRAGLDEAWGRVFGEWRRMTLEEEERARAKYSYGGSLKSRMEDHERQSEGGDCWGNTGGATVGVPGEVGDDVPKPVQAGDLYWRTPWSQHG